MLQTGKYRSVGSLTLTYMKENIFSLVQLLSHVQLFVTTWTAARQASLSFTNSWSLLKLMFIELVMPSKHLILCLPLFLPSVFPSMRVFSTDLAFRIRWPKYWNFQLNTQDWFPLVLTGLFSLQSKGLSSLIQHHSSKASILRCSDFYMVQLSYSYMTTGKTIALTIQIFVGKVTSLLLNTLSRFIIAFLPRSKCLLISWLHSPFTVILEPKKIRMSRFPFFLHLFVM